jgi:hypothetical protein
VTFMFRVTPVFGQGLLVQAKRAMLVVLSKKRATAPEWMLLVMGLFRYPDGMVMELRVVLVGLACGGCECAELHEGVVNVAGAHDFAVCLHPFRALDCYCGVCVRGHRGGCAKALLLKKAKNGRRPAVSLNTTVESKGDNVMSVHVDREPMAGHYRATSCNTS